MTVGILLVTHGKLGHVLLETITDVIGEPPLATEVLEVRRVQATDVLLTQGRRMIERLDAGDGVLILTDLYGSTPSNIASRLLERPATALVSGINLPMMITVFNYPKLGLAALARAVTLGGQDGIAECAVDASLPPQPVTLP